LSFFPFFPLSLPLRSTANSLFNIDLLNGFVTRYVADQDFQDAAFNGLEDEIFDSVAAAHS
jgi:hypothetical protein